jgi:molybdopterin-guanine dinucleotide biosynthesis protein A
MTSGKRAGEFAGFILAGGRSSRMGCDKAMLEIDGITMIDRAIDLIRSAGVEPAVIGSFDESLRLVRVPLISDDWPGAGPLGGIASALRHTQSTWNLVIACDMPYLTTEWLEFLLRRAFASSGDAVVPMNEDGAEPLCAMYNKSAETAIRGALENGVRKVTEGLAKLRVDCIEREEWKGFDSDGFLFKNMNQPADYEEAKCRLGGRAKK